jgi:Ca2+-transporting ATPase
MRSQRASSVGMVFRGHHNAALYGAMVGSFLLTTAVVEVDFLSNLFGFTKLNLTEYCISLGLAFLIIPLVEIIKLIQRKTAKSEA